MIKSTFRGLYCWIPLKKFLILEKCQREGGFGRAKKFLQFIFVIFTFLGIFFKCWSKVQCSKA